MAQTQADLAVTEVMNSVPEAYEKLETAVRGLIADVMSSDAIWQMTIGEALVNARAAAMTILPLVAASLPDAAEKLAAQSGEMNEVADLLSNASFAGVLDDGDGIGAALGALVMSAPEACSKLAAIAAPFLAPAAPVAAAVPADPPAAVAAAAPAVAEAAEPGDLDERLTAAARAAMDAYRAPQEPGSGPSASDLLAVAESEMQQGQPPE